MALTVLAMFLGMTWAMYKRPRTEVLPIVVALFLGLHAVHLMIFSFRPHARVDEDGLEEVLVLRKPTRHAWNEVMRIHSNAWMFVISWRSGRATVIPLARRGLDVFADFVLTRVPPTCIPSDVTLRRLTYFARRRRRILPHAFAPEPPDPVREIALRWRDNPFAVLGLAPDCSRADVERAGQKLLGLLALGHAAARTYRTPFESDVERTEHRVRAAMAELRNPERRIAHEIWARMPLSRPAESAAADPAAFRWESAMAAIGWRRG
ncbi:hypothetical protein LZC95_14325 [Pendulispora brunnea]|uniref:J domain-containing protein n=1 Tax=Pendulispora brunnea TaxID=2905690 RepID=A0ABZ2KM08_9BACT